MIDNLLSNAIKYNQQNGKIVISLTHHSLCIQNEGEPIPKELRENIKKRYFRLNPQIKGYGIGLDIIQKVVQSQKWKLCISLKDHLNTFEILF